jgi:streptogramin lyase
LQRIDGSGWSLAQTPGAVWVAQPFFGSRPVRKQDRPARRLLRIATSGVRRISVMELQTQPGHVSSADGVVWVTVNDDLARIDAAERSPTLTKVPVDFSPNYHVTFAGGLWVSDLRANRVHKVC